MGFFNKRYSRPLSPHRQNIRLMRVISGAVGLGLTLQFVSAFGFAIDTAYLPTSGYIQSTLINAAGYIFSFMLGYFAICAMTGVGRESRLPKGRVQPDFALAAVGCGLLFSFGGATITAMINSMLASVTGTEPVMGDIPTPDSGAGWVLYFITVAVLPAVLEEILFRGAVLGALRPMGEGFAIVMSSVMFALAHGNLVQGPNSFMMGLLLASITVYSGSVNAAMLLHFCNNFVFSLVGAADEITGGLPDGTYSAFIVGLMFWGTVGLVHLVRTHPGVFGRLRIKGPLGWKKAALHFFTTPAMLLFLLLSIALIAVNFAPVPPDEGALLKVIK